MMDLMYKAQVEKEMIDLVNGVEGLDEAETVRRYGLLAFHACISGMPFDDFWDAILSAKKSFVQ